MRGIRLKFVLRMENLKLPWEFNKYFPHELISTFPHIEVYSDDSSQSKDFKLSSIGIIYFTCLILTQLNGLILSIQQFGSIVYFI